MLADPSAPSPRLSRRDREAPLSDAHVKIVIPCTNERAWCRATVDSILGNTDYGSYEIVISANGDTMTDFSFLEESPYRERVRLREEREALGVGRSKNLVVTPGDAAYYVFLDAHCLIDQRDWLRRAVATLEQHPEASMVQPEVRGFVHPAPLAPGAKPAPSTLKPGYREYCIRWVWPYEDEHFLVQPELAPRSPEVYEGMAGSGMAVFTRAERFHHLGGFDSEVNGWYFETLDYCIGAWLRGFPMLVDPSIRVYHRQKQIRDDYDISYLTVVHGILRTAYKYLSPRRRDIAQILFRRLGYADMVDEALRRVRQGRWLSERAGFLKERIHDDDWLFQKFEIYEERHGVHVR